MLADADGGDNLFGTLDDNLRLLPGSICLNAGDDGAVPAGVFSDLDGKPRRMDGVVDMGAYEYNSSQTSIATTSACVLFGQDVSPQLNPQTLQIRGCGGSETLNWE